MSFALVSTPKQIAVSADCCHLPSFLRIWIFRERNVEITGGNTINMTNF